MKKIYMLLLALIATVAVEAAGPNALYLIGEPVGDGKWHCDQGEAFKKVSDGEFELDYTFSGTKYFGIVSVLGSDWSETNSNRYKWTGNGDCNMVADQSYPIASGEGAFKLGAGEWHIVVDFNKMTITASVKKVVETKLDWTIHGSIFGGDWETKLMTNNNGIWTLTADCSNGEFGVKQIENDDLASTATWLSFSAADFNITEASLGKTLQLTESGGKNGNFGLSGKFTFTFDANAKTLVIKAEGEVKPDVKELYLTGSFYLNDKGGWACSEDNMFKYADGLYTMTDYEIPSTGIFQVSSSDWKTQYGGKDVVIDLDHLTATLSGGGYDDNATINCTGKFDITFNATTREIKFVAKGGNQQGGNEPAELYLMGEKFGYDANSPKFDCADGVYTIKGLEVTPGNFTIQSADYKVGFGNNALTISSSNLSGVLTEGAYDNNVTLDLNAKVDIEFVLATKTVTFTVVGQVTPPAATVPATLYICGDLKGASWSTTDMVAMTKNGNVFTAENVEFEVNGENTVCWFNLPTSTGADWDAVNSADRYGAAKEDTPAVIGGDNAVTKYTVNVDASNCKSWTIEPGKYNLTVDFADAAAPVMVITKVPTSGVSAIDAEAGEAVYYNFQGQRVANPEKGMYIRVVNGKAVKVVR